jgi:hypothetical protein
MDTMKRLTAKKKRIDIRLKGRPDSGIWWTNYSKSA